MNTNLLSNDLEKIFYKEYKSVTLKIDSSLNIDKSEMEILKRRIN